VRSAHLAYRGHWDLGFVKQCSVCGLLVPVHTDFGPMRGRPVAHFPVLDEDAYEGGTYCRGGHQPAVPFSEEIEVV
jgi:hypothetical protein